jgi:hypothetical protein
MWEPRPLTLLWAFTVCYSDSFTLISCIQNSKSQKRFMYFDTVIIYYWWIDVSVHSYINLLKETPVENSLGSLTIFMSFRIIKSPCFLPYSFPFLQLSNQNSRPTYNAVSQQEHEQIVSIKPFPLYSVIHFMYPRQNIVYTHRIDTTLGNERLLVHSWYGT